MTVPKCGDVAELINKDLVKQRSNERQYLKMVIECLQLLGRQGITLRGNDDGSNNLTQLLLLRGEGPSSRYSKAAMKGVVQETLHSS